ncbi:hypothetical protein [Almyronema epifaneia]|uniref:Uncharacterized protein n=1 Tax=Almyronema epifaneia S1 TaxID=2991925 RepID=A0ABW6IFD6_9CYAN
MRVSNSWLKANKAASPTNRLAQMAPLARTLATQLLNWLAANDQPQINERYCSKQGRYWEVYDPITQSRQTFDSEQALRVWLEQRYYESK